MTHAWRGWARREDLPHDLLRLVDEGAFAPLLNPQEAHQIKATVMETFAEVLDTYLEDVELRWRVDHVHRARPGMPMEAVFAAVAAGIGVSPSRLKSVWYVSRRKSRTQELVRAKLRGAQP